MRIFKSMQPKYSNRHCQWYSFIKVILLENSKNHFHYLLKFLSSIGLSCISYMLNEWSDNQNIFIMRINKLSEIDVFSFQGKVECNFKNLMLIRDITKIV